MNKENNILNQMTLEEKVSLICQNMENSIEGNISYNIPGIDLYIMDTNRKDDPIYDFLKSSWNVKTSYKLGEFYAKTALKKGTSIIYGPILSMHMGQASFFTSSPLMAEKMLEAFAKGVHDAGALWALPIHSDEIFNDKIEKSLIENYYEAPLKNLLNKNLIDLISLSLKTNLCQNDIINQFPNMKVASAEALDDILDKIKGGFIINTKNPDAVKYISELSRNDSALLEMINNLSLGLISFLNLAKKKASNINNISLDDTVIKRAKLQSNILLKNKNDLLPIKINSSVLILGSFSLEFVKEARSSFQTVLGIYEVKEESKASILELINRTDIVIFKGDKNKKLEEEFLSYFYQIGKPICLLSPSLNELSYLKEELFDVIFKATQPEFIFNIILGNMNPCGYLGYQTYHFNLGEGLTYSKVELKNFLIEEKRITFSAKNNSDLAVSKLIMLYISKGDSKKLILKDFILIGLMPHEMKNFEFEIKKDTFLLYDEQDKEFKVKDSKYKVYIGGSIKDISYEREINPFDLTHFKELSIYKDREARRNFYKENNKVEEFVSFKAKIFIWLLISATLILASILTFILSKNSKSKLFAIALFILFLVFSILSLLFLIKGKKKYYLLQSDHSVDLLLNLDCDNFSTEMTKKPVEKKKEEEPLLEEDSYEEEFVLRKENVKENEYKDILKFKEDLNLYLIDHGYLVSDESLSSLISSLILNRSVIITSSVDLKLLKHIANYFNALFYNEIISNLDNYENLFIKDKHKTPLLKCISDALSKDINFMVLNFDSKESFSKVAPFYKFLKGSNDTYFLSELKELNERNKFPNYQNIYYIIINDFSLDSESPFMNLIPSINFKYEVTKAQNLINEIDSVSIGEILEYKKILLEAPILSENLFKLRDSFMNNLNKISDTPIKKDLLNTFELYSGALLLFIKDEIKTFSISNDELLISYLKNSFEKNTLINLIHDSFNDEISDEILDMLNRREEESHE